jgi:hypothetical protein
MSEEYQRLQDEATAVDCKIREIQENCRVGSAAELAAIEEQLGELAIRRASLAKAMILLASVDDPAFAEKQRAFVGRLPHRYHSQGSRPKVIEFPGGVRATVRIPYFHRQKDPAKVAAKPGRGLYPALMLLGIVKGRTPHVRQRMVKAAALLGSYEEAAEMLADSCIDVSVNALREACGHAGRRLAQLTSSGSVAVEGHVKDRRIVVSLDGGRVRLREPRKGRTKKGRKRFSARWRVPRLFIIYAVDEHGRMADDFPPIIDGTLASCDRLFEMLQAFLVSLEVTTATRILFVADGAAWIWRRVPKLIRALGLQADQVQELIDFWHAVEYLGKIAESVKLTGSKRKHWLTTQKKRLIRGEIGAVVDELKACLPRRRKRDQRTWLNYFCTHGLKHRRMAYAAARSSQLPIGSGAVESAIRRVINLRVKSNATYWLRENAEAMIRLRAWIKAGRGESLFQQTTYAPLTIAL